MNKINNTTWTIFLTKLILLIILLFQPSNILAMPQGALIQNNLKINYAKTPLNFEPNKGQTDKAVKFLSRGNGYVFFLVDNGAVLKFSKKLKPIQMKFVNANDSVKISSLNKHSEKVNYFIGNNKKNWLKGINTFEKVKYTDIYPGIDLVYYGNHEKLEYDFVVSPGANPKDIKISFSGAENVFIDANENLVLHTPDGDVTQLAPLVYQEISGIKQKIDSKYVLLGDGKSVSFNILNYDVTKPLVIDPVLVYSTFLGGINNDFGWGIDVDSNGNAYVVGSTLSVSDFPTTSGVVQPAFGGGAAGSNIFVTKFNPQGIPVYSTYLGGSGLTFGFDIKIDKEGNAYVAGTAYAVTDFPTTMGAFQTTFGGGAADAVVVKLNPNGSSLLFSTFLGGASFDGGTDQFGGGNELEDGNFIFDSFWHLGIDIDTEKNVYITGTTFSLNFPTTTGAFQATKAGSGPTDAFVTKLNPTGSSLVYSTFLGGASAETGSDIRVDKNGNAFVCGTTASTDFPTTPGSFLPVLNSPGNGYVAKLNATGSSLVYSSYIGGSATDSAFGIDIDDQGNAYVAGESAVAVNPPFFPITDGVIQMNYAGGVLDAFVTKVNPDGSMLVYSTFIGGLQAEHANAIAVDKKGSAYIIGHTNSNDFPTKDQIQSEPNDGGFDAFVSKLNPSGSAFEYSTYLGGSQFEDGLGIAVDSNGAAYITGYTEAPVNPPFFPSTTGAFQDKVTGNADAFIAKISDKTGGGSIPTGDGKSDLVGSWLKLSSECRGTESKVRCKIKGKLKIENGGTGNAKTSFVKFFLSNDSTFSPDDTFLKQVATGKVTIEGSKKRALAVQSPKGVNVAGKFILAVLDSENSIDESNEGNNTIAFGPLP